LDFVAQHPYHVDALYHVESFFRLQGNFKQANLLLEQILFLYESCFSLEFKQIFADTSNQFTLSFSHNEYSAALFATVFQMASLLGKKGCFRAALEYNKFLLKLSPLADPTGALLCLDYNALSSKQYRYLSYFASNYAAEFYKSDRFSLMCLPNYLYSCALSKFCELQSLSGEKRRDS